MGTGFTPNVCSDGTFEYKGNTYSISISFPSDDENKKPFTMVSQYILDVEMSVKLNRLYSDGFIRYKDMDGDVPKIFQKFGQKCVISFYMIKTDISDQFHGMEVEDKDNFSHVFFVDNVRIDKREDDGITYTIELVGIEYLGIINHVDYSNYDIGGEKIVQIVKKMLVEYAGQEVDESFDQVQDGVTFGYITNGNDTVQSVIDYVMQKQFYYADIVNSSVIFLTYDIISGKYGVFQPGNTKSKKKYDILLSMGKDNSEESIGCEKALLGTNSDMRMSDILIPVSDISLTQYNNDAGYFTTKTFTSNKITNFFGGGESKLRPVEKNDKVNIHRNASQWSNDTNIMNDMLKAYLYWDSLLLNIGGVIDRKLTDVLDLEVDNTFYALSMYDTVEDSVDDLDRFKRISGPWMITKVRYIIRPNQNSFKQNLQLSRGFSIE